MVRRLLKDESGQTMLEYIVIVVFVVIAAIIAFRLVKNIVQTKHRQSVGVVRYGLVRRR